MLMSDYIYIALMGILDDISSKIADLDELLSNPFKASISPYLAVLGNLFYAFVWFFISGMVYLKTESAVTTVILSIIFFAIYAHIFSSVPFLYQLAGITLAFALTGLLYKLFYTD